MRMCYQVQTIPKETIQQLLKETESFKVFLTMESQDL